MVYQRPVERMLAAIILLLFVETQSAIALTFRAISIANAGDEPLGRAGITARSATVNATTSVTSSNFTDVSSRLRHLYDQGIAAPPLEHIVAVPREIQATLNRFNLEWRSLSGTIQRLLLWDAGYVWANGSTITRVYTQCGLTMDETILSRGALVEAGCRAVECGEFAFAPDSCTNDSIAKLAKCAAENITAHSPQPVWAEDTLSMEMPHPTLFRYSSILYSIQLRSQDSVDPATCSAPPALAIPCTQYQIGQNWCLPKASPWMTDFLQEFSKTSPQLNRVSLVMWSIAAIITALATSALIYTHRQAQQMRNGLEGAAAAKGADVGSQGDDNTRDFVCILAKELELNAGYTKRQRSTTSSEFSCLKPSLQSSSTSYADILSASEVLIAFQNDPLITSKRIPMMDIHFSRRICDGASGEVHLGRYQGQRVAIKQLLRLKRNEVADVESFAMEIQLTATLNHPNVIRMVGVAWNTFQNMVLILEYRSGGDLLCALRKRGAHWTWTNEKLNIAIGVARAMKYLHERQRPLIHRDIKSRNILVDSATAEPALCDFGSSRNISTLDLLSTDPAGTILWSAPEVIREQEHTAKADIYSFGIVLAELDTCALPYADERDDAGRPIPAFRIAHMVVENQIQPKLREDCPRFIRDLVMRCVNHTPDDRPTATEVLLCLMEAEQDCAAIWNSRA